MERLYYNATELAVEQYLDKYIRLLECCTCDQCRADILCMVLNNLPPHYVSSSKGALYVKLRDVNIQNETDIVKQLTSAITKVKAHPSHPVPLPEKE